MKKILLGLCICMFMASNVLGADLVTINKAQLESLLQQNRGKVVMLNFFATWCPPCRAELPELVKLRAKYPESKFTLIGLSVDESVDPVGPFIKSAGVNYPVYMADKSITNAFNITSVPHNTFFEPDGALLVSEPGIADLQVLSGVVNDMLKAH